MPLDSYFEREENERRRIAEVAFSVTVQPTGRYKVRPGRTSCCPFLSKDALKRPYQSDEDQLTEERLCITQIQLYVNPGTDADVPG